MYDNDLKNIVQKGVSILHTYLQQSVIKRAKHQSQKEVNVVKCRLWELIEVAAHTATGQLE